MLRHLAIRDFVIVEQVELELGAGMTVLTGETGAGKSILVDALGLALGERASAAVVRPGAGRAEVSATFDLSTLPTVRDWLGDRELDTPDAECVARRTVSADGRSRAYVNGTPVPVQALRELGDRLVDMHGQHAHQSLLRRDVQRQVLDAFGGHAGLVGRVAELHERHAALTAELGSLTGDGDAGARTDYLRYQLRELEELDLAEGALEGLEDEHRRLSHGAALREACEHALELAEGEGEHSATARVQAAVRTLEAQLAHDPALAPVLQLLGDARIHLEEAGAELRRYAGGLDLDPEHLAALEARLTAIHDLARKHRVEPGALPAHRNALAGELDRLEHGAERRTVLESELADTLTAYREAAQALSKARHMAAEGLGTEITGTIAALGMPKGRFQVSVDFDATGDPAAAGLDRVEFQVSANPGQPPAPMTRVASGGELSRISLAIQVVAAEGLDVPTLVFDEVDAGIGGPVGEVVGRQLRVLAERRQTLCITHLPQVASCAQHHLHVEKEVETGATFARLVTLDGEGRVQEIARMLGGLTITDRTLAHAREMLAGA